MLSHLNTKHELIIYLLLINCISRRNECMSSKGQSRMGRRQQKTKDKPLWKKIMRIALIAILVIGVGVGTLFTYYIVTAPSIDAEKLSDPFSSSLLDIDDDLFVNL